MHKAKYVDFRAVKQSVSIFQILDYYGITQRFKRSKNGDSLSGPCPLHHGENPTQFRISVSKNCWHCFSQCGHGGNILDFVSIMEDCTIREAAIRISEWFDLSTDAPPEMAHQQPAPASRASRNTAVPVKPQGKAVRVAEDNTPNRPLDFQLQNLDSTHPYLAERGLNQDAIVNFDLGHCSKGSMAGRIVIPIHNPNGEVVAYAGRWPGEPPGDTPKYKLPPGFKKSLELFNLDRAKDEPEDTPLVIVEGFFDCIKLWQHGIRRVVALMGSSHSPAQKDLIVEHIDARSRIILLLNEDDAGRAGREDITLRLAKRMFVHIVELEEGQQPEDIPAERLSDLLA